MIIENIRKPEGCEAIVTVQPRRGGPYYQLEAALVTTTCPRESCPLQTKPSARFIEVIQGHSLKSKISTSISNGVINKRCPLVVRPTK